MGKSGWKLSAEEEAPFALTQPDVNSSNSFSLFLLLTSIGRIIKQRKFKIG